MGTGLQGASDLLCPFCGYEPSSRSDTDEKVYDLEHHVEVVHRETGTGQSPFEISADPCASLGEQTLAEAKPSIRLDTTSSASGVREAGPNEPEDRDVDCPRNCGDRIPTQLLGQHINLHQAEDVALEDLEGQPGRAISHKTAFLGPGDCGLKTDTEHNQQESDNFNKRGLRDLFSMSAALDKMQRKSDTQYPRERLGRKELGPHAWEEQMPARLLKQLKDGPRITWVDKLDSDGRVRRVERVANETPGLVTALAELCRQDRSVSKAWFCSPGTKHIFKMRHEGGFCGYRNIQMQVSWMQYQKHSGYQHFGSVTPNILDLQVMIEEAWKRGFNSTGPAETGGILGTRKYIGTPEAQALFQSLGIECHADAFTRNKIANSKESVHTVLLQYVIEYFSQGVTNPSQKVYMTDLPPLYFQHPGHSLTIVGIEVHRNREINLLVFDPQSATDPAMIRYLDSRSVISNPGKILRAFRRGEYYLHKFKSFETLGVVRTAV